MGSFGGAGDGCLSVLLGVDLSGKTAGSTMVCALVMVL